MHILVLSPRVAPGLLTLAAWDVLRAATVVTAAADDAHTSAIRAVGIDITVAEQPAFVPDTVWIAPPGQVRWAQELADDLVHGHDERFVEVMFGSYELPGSALLDVVDVMDRLRRECPWTREQTHATLAPYLLEEAHETLEALDTQDWDLLCEELGDLLMQIVFHARIAAEQHGWDIDDVAQGIAHKLIRRSPHVFADGQAATADDVDAAWQAIKATEKRRAKVDDGIAATLPALAYADKVAGRMGLEQVAGDDVGSRLLAEVLKARAQGVDAEQALRQRVRALL
jgi:XTP/dITP diphosphohydrolase